ncbi:molybdopterin/thiamine biosynthesis adenylyltransferase [Rhodovulum imhoffii]|uniref:Molybdopterin-synthase adenylyltransferase n=1 Tax=Rhodovulum imhoffii TaxID=365340 RepID=A0A2T5BUJ5_9RHOB|nr:molybdopterin-synthase adenylyltransferase MoeB [Rhodovulum imhoffii]PTN03190.1 molybdopterin/thiamine biosynthesis adenylyltransferase [Rhodovulum imhoffii]
MAVLALALGLWVLGAVLKVAPRTRWVAIVAVYVGVLVIQVSMPVAHPLRVAIGGTPRGWAALGVIVGFLALYRAGVRVLHRRAEARNPAPVPEGPFTADELDRYARHIVLREIGGPGQKRLKAARVLVVGAGGLGSPVLLYLGAAGVGTLGVVDDDVVSGSNLQRQVVHTDARRDEAKVISAQAAVTALNPHVTVQPHNCRLTRRNVRDLLAGYDLILDGSDNAQTRYLINEVAVALGTPLISGAVSQWEGQISLFDPVRGGACYACVFPEAVAPGLAPSCAEGGVVGPLPGVIGTMMALEAVKFLTGAGEDLRGRMLIYDGSGAIWREIRTRPTPNCLVCGGLSGRETPPAG